MNNIFGIFVDAALEQYQRATWVLNTLPHVGKVCPRVGRVYFRVLALETGSRGIL